MFVALHTYFRIAAFMYAGAVCCMSFYDNIIIVVRSVARTYKDEVFCQFVFFALCVYAYRVIECCTGLLTACHLAEGVEHRRYPHLVVHFGGMRFRGIGSGLLEVVFHIVGNHGICAEGT